MNKNESKYYQTAVKMDKAFLELLDHREFAYITVKEICKTAGVNRSTFYLHYETTADLLAESVEYMQEQFFSYMDKDASKFVEGIQSSSADELYLITPDYLEPFLLFIQENRRLFATALKNSKALRLDTIYERMFRFVFSPILERYRVPEQDRPFIMSFYIHGLMAILENWIRTDCAEAPEYIIHLMRQCIPKTDHTKE